MNNLVNVPLVWGTTHVAYEDDPVRTPTDDDAGEPEDANTVFICNYTTVPLSVYMYICEITHLYMIMFVLAEVSVLCIPSHVLDMRCVVLVYTYVLM